MLMAQTRRMLADGRAKDAIDWARQSLAFDAPSANRGITQAVLATAHGQLGWYEEGMAVCAGAPSDPADYDGSDLQLFGVTGGGPPDPDWAAVVRRRGTAVAFPAFEHHRVTPLERGARCSLVCWVGGPPFR